MREEDSIGGLSALKNVGKPTKDGDLGTAAAPIHMVTAGGNFKDQLWRTIRFLAVAFLWMSGVGALLVDQGISKGITMPLWFLGSFDFFCIKSVFDGNVVLSFALPVG